MEPTSANDLLDYIHPNVALTASTIIYPLLFRLVTPTNVTAARFMKTREAISVAHCTLIVSATVFELYRQADHWVPPAWRGEPSPRHHLRIVEASPRSTHAIIAFECGYLLQDLVVLINGARRVASDGHARTVLSRNVNWRVLGWHHLGITLALGVFHIRALRHTARASLVVLMMLLMNVSTPFGTLHWYLVRFRPSWRRSICCAHMSYLATYGLARIVLFYGILHVFGAWRNHSAVEAFRRLPWLCQVGTSAITGSNAFWWLRGVYRFVELCLDRRHVNSRHTTKPPPPLPAGPRISAFRLA